MNKPLTAEEVCQVIELITLHVDDDWAGELYTLVHNREGSKCCGRKREVDFSHRLKEYWENVNKAPNDPTKLQDMDYPSISEKTNVQDSSD